MPKVTISARSRVQLRIALRQYQSELAEIIDPITREAKYAGVQAESHVPPDLAAEDEYTKVALRLVASETSDIEAYFGRDIPEIYPRVMATALMLRKDDLDSRLETVEADPLTPTEAGSPLREEISRIGAELDNFWSQYGVSSWLAKLKERREMKLGLSFPRSIPVPLMIEDGEGQTIEFMEGFPEQAHDLAKEIAAFGTSNPGNIILGVGDNGMPSGIPRMRRPKPRDDLRTRIEGISSNGILPSLPVRIKFENIGRNVVAVIEVPKGPEPVYYTKNGVPYIRHGSISRPALPQEVNELVRRSIEQKLS